MKGYKIKISGNWGHFRRPETNNNPITFDFIPKTALIGIVASVVGLDRSELKGQYEKLCNKIRYSVRLIEPINKISHSFRIYKYKGSLSGIENPPQAYEFLKSPHFEVVLEGEIDILERFIDNLRLGKSIYTATLGLINCPATIEFISELDLVEKNLSEPILVQGFIPKECKIKVNSDVMISYDKIPVFQNDNWLNTKTKEVYYFYSSNGGGLEVTGTKKVYQDKKTGEYWFLI